MARLNIKAGRSTLCIDQSGDDERDYNGPVLFLEGAEEGDILLWMRAEGSEALSDAQLDGLSSEDVKRLGEALIQWADRFQSEDEIERQDQ